MKILTNYRLQRCDCEFEIYCLIIDNILMLNQISFKECHTIILETICRSKKYAIVEILRICDWVQWFSSKKILFELFYSSCNHSFLVIY